MNSKTNKLVAFAVVALFTFSGLMILTDDSDAMMTGSQIYTLEMRTGQTCIYDPTTNLDSKITVTGSEGVRWDPDIGRMSASFDSVDTSGGLNAVVKAVWTSTVNPDVTQSAEQTIQFKIYGHVTIDGRYDSTVAKGIVGGQTSGTVVYTPSIPTPTPGTKTEIVCDIPSDEYIGWDSEKNRVYLKTDIPEDVEDFSLTFDVRATNSPVSEDSTLAEETAVVHVTVGFGQSIKITSPDMIETYVGCDDPSRNTYKVLTNYDGVSSVSITKTEIGQVVPQVSGIVASKGDGSVRFNPDAVDFPERPLRPYYKDFTFFVKVSGTAADGSEVEDSKIVTLRVWAGLKYITIPTMENITIFPDEENFQKVGVSAIIGDADGIKFDWGDGSDTFDQKTDTKNKITYRSSHEYADKAIHLITLSAYNTSGENVAYIMYDAETGEYEEGQPSNPDNPSEGHGNSLWWLPIALGVLAVVLAIIFAVWPVSYLLAISSIISGIAAIVSYFLI